MKAALITEQQIKLLERYLMASYDPCVKKQFNEARTVIQSLKVMDHDAVDSAWNKFNKAISDGPTSPFPEMAARFESYYGQSWTDKDWRKETSIWAAAWKEAIAYQKRQEVANTASRPSLQNGAQNIHEIIQPETTDLPKSSTCTNSQTEQEPSTKDCPQPEICHGKKCEFCRDMEKAEQMPVTNSDLYSTAGRLALELECLLLDTKDISIASKWWDSAHEALDQWRKFHFRFCNTLDSATHSADSAETFGKLDHYE